MNWFVRYRQSWIKEKLSESGAINRSDLMEKFEISRVQASLDLSRFIAANPGAMVYDMSRKCYVKAP
jgi:hypothetical protein